MNINNPLISIVTVTYNAEDFIEKTIKSILNQSYKNIEYIIIDGNSTDNTKKIIKSYQDNISYFISEPDKGIYDAMNKGIDKASGEWINFMNAGDSFYNNFILEEIVSNLHNTDLLYGGVNFVNKQYKTIAYNPPLDMNCIYRKMPCCHQTVFVKLEIMKKYKYNLNYQINADLNFLFKFYTNNYTYKYLDKPFINFINEGIHTQDVPRGFLDELYVSSKYMKKCSDIYKHEAYSNLINASPISTDTKKTTYDNISKIYKQIIEINKKYKNIIIYGNSNLTKLITPSLTINYKITDRTAVDNPNLILPENIIQHNYDIILITLLGREKEIKDFLVSKINLPKNKILTFLEE